MYIITSTSIMIISMLLTAKYAYPAVVFITLASVWTSSSWRRAFRSSLKARSHCNCSSSHCMRLLQLNRFNLFTARAYARAVLGVIILSVRPSVRLSVCLSHAWIVTKINDALWIFYTTRKRNHSATLIPTVVDGRRSLPSEICAQRDPPPLRKTPTSTDFRS